MTGSMQWFVAGDDALVASKDPATAMRHLRSFAPEHPQASTVARIVAEIDRHGAAAALRGTAPGHLTGSALVVDAERCRLLLMLHTKLRRWLQPGGHADGDLELAGVALREATEETGIEGLAVLVPAVDVDVHEVDHGDALGRHLHLDVRFVVAAPPGAEVRGNHESTDLRWVTLPELRSLADEEGLVALAERGLAVAASAPPPPGGWLS